jgi:hypothetical protein
MIHNKIDMMIIAVIVIFCSLIRIDAGKASFPSRYATMVKGSVSYPMRGRRNNRLLMVAAAVDNNDNNKSKIATLSIKSLWKLNLKLMQNGFKDVDVELKIRFIPDRNYEPPQGRVYIESDLQGIVKVTEKGYSGVWSLSEDKNDRKDGLWVWGLFEEPKYPYLYFYLDVFDSIILPSGEEEPLFGTKGIPNDRLSFRFSHLIEKDRGTTLTKGEMTYKVTEMMKADPLGIGGQVDIGDQVNAGVVNIVCLLNDASVRPST